MSNGAFKREKDDQLGRMAGLTAILLYSTVLAFILLWLLEQFVP